MAFLIIMHTTYVESLLQPCFEREEIEYNEAYETLLQLLSWDKFLQGFNERWQVENAEPATWELMLQTHQTFPRHLKGKHRRGDWKLDGWHIVKFHTWSIMTSICLKFGCVKVTHCSAGEKNQKWCVNRMGTNMIQMRLDFLFVRSRWIALSMS